jgi:hypothetical protein
MMTVAAQASYLTGTLRGRRVGVGWDARTGENTRGPRIISRPPCVDRPFLYTVTATAVVPEMHTPG